MLWLSELFFFFSSRRRHTRCALVTGVQTCALPIFLEASGIAIEAALIVIFDTNSWRVLPQVVAKDEQLERAIIDAGNHYWNNHVLRGELPPAVPARCRRSSPAPGRWRPPPSGPAPGGDRKRTRLNSRH